MNVGRALRAGVVGLLLGAVVVGPTLAARATGSTAGMVFLQTVPALPGVHLRVGSTEVTTDRSGAARVGVGDLNNIAGRVSLVDKVLDSRTTMSLAFVKPVAHAGRHESHLSVGLDVASTVTLAIGRGSTSVSPSTVRLVRLHSLAGQTVDVNPQRTATVSLLSRKARYVGGVVTTQVVSWTVDSLRAAAGVSVTATRSGFDPFTSRVWPLVLQPVRGTVVLDTVPATAGVTFLLGGASFTTDARGHAIAPVSDLNAVDSRLRLATPVASGGTTVSLLRVTRVAAGAPFRRHVVAALAVSRPVSLTFTDRTGHAVPVDRIGGVVIAGDGSTVTVTGAHLQDQVSLLSEKARLVKGVWTPQQVTYAVTRVTVEGSDAVFAGQQRFTPSRADSWPISLSVFNVSVTVRDVLFGSALSSGATVTRPDGVQYGVQLSGDEPTVLRSLVRGQYVLTTASAVMGGRATILVSKSSDVELRVITLPDVIVVLSLMLALCAAVVWLGRRWTRHPASRGSRRT